MGFLSRLVFKNYSLADLDRDLQYLRFGQPTATGMRVNEDSALRYITVYSLVRVLGETLGCLPLHVFRERPGGGADRAKDHPNQWLFHSEPNPDMSSLSWREAQMGHISLGGNGYNLLTLNRRGEVTDVQPWDWHLMSAARNKDTGKLEYLLWDRGKKEFWPADRVLHIPGLGFDGISGYSVVTMGREAVGIGLAATEFAGKFYGQGMNIGGVLQTDAVLGPEVRQNLKDDIMERGAGLANSWVPLILEQGMKYARIPMPLKDAQFIEQFQLTDIQLCGMFRVPPHMIARLERSTNNNIEKQSLEFVMYTLLPWVSRWEQAINRRCFSRREREQGYYVKFNVSGLLRGDYKSRQEGLAQMRQNGVINADEWRALEEFNPIEDGSGKKYLVNGNMTPVDESGANKDRTHWTENEKRKADGLPPIPEGDAIYKPASTIPALEFASDDDET